VDGANEAKICRDSERNLTSTGDGGATEPSSLPGVVDPLKWEELKSYSRLLADRPLPLPFPLLTSLPTSGTTKEDDDNGKRRRRPCCS
jgi:hypothetical protein